MSHMTAANAANPFQQPAACWQLSFYVPMECVIPLEESLSEHALSVSSFEDPDDHSHWNVQILYPHKPDMDAVSARVRTLAEALALSLPLPELTEVAQQDWLALVARDFPPMRIGRFFVHGVHAKDAVPVGAVALQVEAGAAFGSGEHATTSGCLRAIDALARKREFVNILDMGCGSAILAIAAAKCFPRAKALAIDIDPVSVEVARENIRINRAGAQVQAYAADGYASALVKKRAPYDLILANILARPLVKFSAALAENLAPGGAAVLSGLLSTQETYVREAHLRHGLTLVRRIKIGGWSTLVLRK